MNPQAEANARIADVKARNLEYLDLGDLSLEVLPEGLASLTMLKALSLGMCSVTRNDDTFQSDLHPQRKPSKFSDLTPLAGLVSLQYLDLGWCKGVSDLTPLASLVSLRTLDLSWCESMSDLTPLASLVSLQSLHLSGCESVSDLTPLAGLVSLQSLDLSGCESVSDLTLLESLVGLQTLALSWCEDVSDLTPLASLVSLQYLDLGWCGVSDLMPLVGLVSLQYLDLSWCGVSDLMPLAGLVSLQDLDLSGLGHVSDLTPLAGLVSLQSLRLSGCEGVSNLTPLAGLVGLRYLYINGCEGVSDLTPLAGLVDLQAFELNRCEAVSDLTPLAGFFSLQSLYLGWCKGVSDLTPLAGLVSLQYLQLSECEGVSDLTPLAGLISLQYLDLSGCENISSFSVLHSCIAQLDTLVLFGCRLDDIPLACCGSDDSENVIDQVRAHFADLAAGEARDAERKVFILGNGGVGKTQLARRLQGLPFDRSVPTTHGIELGFLTRSVSGITEPVTLPLWDFGGQDIYHGAHSLFLQEDSVYLILWHPEHESGPESLADEIFQNRPLTYWLDFVHSIAGPYAPILIIQSQCDQPGERRANPPAELERFAYIRTLSFSAATDGGLKVLFAELDEAVEYLLERRGLDAIGTGRLEVRKRLRELREEDHKRPSGQRLHRTLTLTDFRELCQQYSGISDPLALLDFLHVTGVVYYRGDVMRDRIVLDQNWAFEAIYALFHRAKTLPLLRRLNGRFTRPDLASLIWQDYSEQEQQLFLEVMQGCGICFPTQMVLVDSAPTQEYLAPDLLDEDTGSHLRQLSPMMFPPIVEVEIQYGFLHDGILRSSLSRIGSDIGRHGIFWKFGCDFYESQHDCHVLIDRIASTDIETGVNAGSLTIRLWGGKANELMPLLLKSFGVHQLGDAPQIRWIKGSPDHPSSRTKEIKATESLGSVVSESEKKLVASPRPLMELKKQPEIFISYAWGEDKTPEGQERGATVDGLENQLKEWGYEPVRDKNVLRNGDLISNFMMQLAKGDCILVIFSGKYLRSEACMTELNGIYENALRDKTRFLQRIIPVTLSCARFSSPADRIEHAKYWDASKKHMQENFDFLGMPDKQRLIMQSRWCQQIGDILAFVSDELHPHRFEDITKDNFEAVHDMLKRKIREEYEKNILQWA